MATAQNPSNDPVWNAYNQYNQDVAQWEADCKAEQESADQWKQLIAEIGELLASGKTQEAFSVMQNQLLGGTIIDGYDKAYQDIQGDVLNITSDIRNILNIAQGIFNQSNPGQTKNPKNPLTPTQESQFAEAVNDLYKIFASQQPSQNSNAWLDPNDVQNALQNLNGLFKAFGKSPSKGQQITAGDAAKMWTFWPTNQNSDNRGVPNPNLTDLQNGFQTLGGVINSPSQAAQTQASYMAQAQNSIEGALKNIYAAIVSFEKVEVQNEKGN
jgi:hypothetical protein